MKNFKFKYFIELGYMLLEVLYRSKNGKFLIKN